MKVVAWVAFKLALFLVSPALAAPGIDLTAEPSGILSVKDRQKLWNAYKTAKQCFRHPTYGAGKGQQVPVLAEKAFRGTAWRSPFTDVRGAPACTTIPGSLLVPKPITVVKLDEAYGQREGAVDGAATWFRRLTTYHRLSNDPIALRQLRQGLLDWAKAKGLGKGIHVSWGDRPVDYQMMTTVLAFVAAAAEIAPTLSADDRAIIGPWLNDLVKQSAASHWKDRQDNKAYMRTYIALIWGLMVGDDRPVQDAVLQLKLAVNDMRPDGSWPIDSQRGGMGLSYNAASTSHIAMIAVALKSARDIDVFSYVVDGRSVHTAIDFVVASIKDPAATNPIYAIPCPDGGDRFGALDKPNTHYFEESASYLLAYAGLFPERESAKYILSRFDPRKAIDSEKNGGAPACQFATSGGQPKLEPLAMPAPPPELPAPAYVVRTREEVAHRTGQSPQINSLLVSTVAKAPKGGDLLDYNIKGLFDFTSKSMTTLNFVLNDNLGKKPPKAFVDCRAETTTYDDGQHHLVLRFRLTEAAVPAFVAEGADCILKALPKQAALRADFLLNHFRDVAIGLVQSGDIDSLKHDGLKLFFRRVAMGEVTVGK